MRHIVPVFLTFLFLLHAPDALACSVMQPSPDWTLQEDAKSAKLLFIGKVEKVDTDHVTLRIGSSGAGAPQNGESLTLDRAHGGTCGTNEYAAGDVWLIVNGDQLFGGTQKLPASDFGAPIPDVLARLDREAGRPSFSPVP